MSNESGSVYPPSLIGAGLPEQGGPPPNAPRSAPLPTPVAQQLQAQQPGAMLRALTAQQPVPVSPGLGFGSGVLSAIGGRPGANPYLAQQAEQQSEYQAQQQRQAELVMRFQERRRQEQQEQTRTFLDLNKEMFGAVKDPAQRARLLKERSTLYQRMGGPAIPEETIASLAENRFSSDTESRIVTGLWSKDPEATKAITVQYGLTPRQIQYYQNPATATALGLSKDKIELDSLKTASDLRFERDKVGAKERFDRGVASPADVRLLGAKGAEEIAEWAIEQSNATGQPVPPAFQPYVTLFQRKLATGGVKTEVELAIARNGGDFNAAWQDLEAAKRGRQKVSKSEFDFSLASQRQSLLAKQKSGQPLTPKELAQLASIEDYQSHSRGGGEETVTTTEKPITLNDNTRPGFQTSVNEVAGRLTGTGLLPKDTSPNVVINGQAVPKTRIIERQYERDHPGQRIQVVWNGHEFSVVRAWEAGETTRTKGPARRPSPLNPAPAAEPSDESDDE